MPCQDHVPQDMLWQVLDACPAENMCLTLQIVVPSHAACSPHLTSAAVADMCCSKIRALLANTGPSHPAC